VKLLQTSEKDFRRRHIARKGASNHGIGWDTIFEFLNVDLESKGSNFGEPREVRRGFS
jgi:hypothetical protein